MVDLQRTQRPSGAFTDADDIAVSVEGGEVTLSGTTESRDARWLAEDLAEVVSGVRTVHNNLRVGHG